ncbi:MAG: methyltransferase domain-containing protein [Armatimonadetes bacterium]|nr:methyltransferase domain-containing protein [Armatimonadota bacterium]
MQVSNEGVQGLLDALVDRLIEQGFVRTPRVEQAFRAIPRHLFVPGVPLEKAYSEEAIVTRRNPEGLPTSSSSMPAIMAAMIEQLDVQSGQRVLEIGAGTGYNAALLAYLVGLEGRVATVEIDADVADEARDHLRQAGFPQVRVVTDDGWFGSPEDGPFDRIEATVGVWDLSPRWVEQLHAGGVLVAPLWLRSGLQAAVALRKENSHLRSESVEPCGFMRLRGPGKGPEEYVTVGEWSIAVDEVSSSSLQVLREILQTAPRVEEAPTLPRGWQTYFRLDEPEAVSLTRNEDWRHGLIGVFDPEARSLAGVEGRPGAQNSRVVVFGGGHALSRLKEALARVVELELRRLRIHAFPRGVSAAPRPQRWVVERPHFTFVIENP